ncbi:MAG: hypothetical protein ACK5VI_10800 [Opitutia bacterium]
MKHTLSLDLASASPTAIFWWKVRNLRNRLRGWKQELIAATNLAPHAELHMAVIRANGQRVELGRVGRRVVTNNGVAAIVDAFQNTFELENFNWHDSGTSSTAEAVGDSVLGTAAGPARVSGTQSEPATNQYRTVATISYTGTASIVEHGLFSASTAGVLFDRTVFTAVGVNNGDSIQFTYTLTVNAGG